MYFELGSNNNELLEFVWAKYEDNGAIGIGPFSCRFQRPVGPNGQLLHPPHGQSNRIPGRPENKAFHVALLSGIHLVVASAFPLRGSECGNPFELARLYGNIGRMGELK